jgi:hypothetical protein
MSTAEIWVKFTLTDHQRKKIAKNKNNNINTLEAWKVLSRLHTYFKYAFEWFPKQF